MVNGDGKRRNVESSMGLLSSKNNFRIFSYLPTEEGIEMHFPRRRGAVSSSFFFSFIESVSYAKSL